MYGDYLRLTGSGFTGSMFIRSMFVRSRYMRSRFIRSGFVRSLQEVYLDVIRGRINIFSILISSSPGKEK